MGGVCCRRRGGAGNSTPENAIITAAELSLGFSHLSCAEAQYSLGKFVVANTLSKTALLRGVSDLKLRFDSQSEDLFYAQFQVQEGIYDAKKLRLAAALLARADKNAKAVAIWDIWTGTPVEEISEASFKELVGVLVDLSIDSIMPLALTDPTFNKDRLKVWGKSQGQKKDKAISHFTEIFLPAGAQTLTYQAFLAAVAGGPDEGFTSMQQLRATIERFRVMSAKFASAFKKGGFASSLTPNKK